MFTEYSFYDIRASWPPSLDKSIYLDLYSNQHYLIGRSVMGEDVRERVKERYAGAALTVLEGTGTASCCGSAGEHVLDLGSGGGIDVLLSAKRVSPGGKAYGLDMTDEMLALAEKNKAEA